MFSRQFPFRKKVSISLFVKSGNLEIVIYEISDYFLKIPDVWDAGKTKKGVPGLRQVFAKQKRGVWGTLGDYFFGFAVAGTRTSGIFKI